MASIQTTLAENVQKYLEQSEWKAAITEMEKLFAIGRDPHVRVRIGDARRKLNQKSQAIREYIRAADLFAEKGFVVKALAQYSLVLRLDSSNKNIRAKMDFLRVSAPIQKLKRGPGEYRMPQPFVLVNSHSSLNPDRRGEQQQCQNSFSDNVRCPAELVHG